MLLASALSGAPAETEGRSMYVERLREARVSEVLDKRYEGDEMDIPRLGELSALPLVELPRVTEILDVVTSCDSEDRMPLIAIVV